ncbi:AAA family ATPase [Nocardiopsis sp. LOL_012]|uniref:cytidylate kinase-like family protein n=1 Tax=Nocardiopsis sp. LOL_012 TaxID=3345409 RepID=UPI003A85CBA5
MDSDDAPRGDVPVVTVSAAFGAGGAVVGPAVADRLGVPFLDRAIPTAVASRVGCSLEEALRHDDRGPGRLERLLVGAARVPVATLGGWDAHLSGAADRYGRLLCDHEFVEETERVIGGFARTGGVVLGRAAAVVLADHPAALHVRLDGDRRDRLRHARLLWDSGFGEDGEGWRDEPPTPRALDDNDRARTAYVRRFYRTDPASPSLYHMVLDGTVLSMFACVELVVRAVGDRVAAAGRRRSSLEQV